MGRGGAPGREVPPLYVFDGAIDMEVRRVERGVPRGEDWAKRDRMTQTADLERTSRKGSQKIKKGATSRRHGPAGKNGQTSGRGGT